MSVDLDDEPAWVWEVDVHGKDGREHEVRVAPSDGRVVSDRIDD